MISFSVENLSLLFDPSIRLILTKTFLPDQESFRQSFDMATVVHIYLFPYFLYPALSIAVTGSVYMTVAIAIGKLCPFFIILTQVGMSLRRGCICSSYLTVSGSNQEKIEKGDWREGKTRLG